MQTNDADSTSLASVEKNASRHLLHTKGTEVSWIRYRKKPRLIDQIRDGDWIVRTLAEGDGVKTVHPPAQVIGRKDWKSSRGTKYQLMLLEVPIDGDTLSWRQFRKRIRRSVPVLDNERSVTRPILDEEAADRLLRLWSSTGKLPKSKTRPSLR